MEVRLDSRKLVTGSLWTMGYSLIPAPLLSSPSHSSPLFPSFPSPTLPSLPSPPVPPILSCALPSPFLFSSLHFQTPAPWLWILHLGGKPACYAPNMEVIAETSPPFPTLLLPLYDCSNEKINKEITCSQMTSFSKASWFPELRLKSLSKPAPSLFSNCSCLSGESFLGFLPQTPLLCAAYSVLRRKCTAPRSFVGHFCACEIQCLK